MKNLHVCFEIIIGKEKLFHLKISSKITVHCIWRGSVICDENKIVDGIVRCPKIHRLCVMISYQAYVKFQCFNFQHHIH